MKKLLVILLAMLMLLSACAPKTPEPQPTPPVTELTPEPEPAPEPTPLSYSWEDAGADRQWNNRVRLQAVIPVFTGENQAALDIINQYFSLLLGKVLDYAEGDLSPAMGESYAVNAQYEIPYATENVLSLAWSVSTAEDSKNTLTTTVQYFNFNPSTGNLLTFRDIFRDTEAARSAFVRKARTQMENTPGYYEHISELADSALDVDNFYYTENGLAVYYPADAVGVATAVELSWEELSSYLET